MLYLLIGRAQEIIRRLRHRPPFLITLFTFCGFTTTGRAATADAYAGYRYEDYREENGRIHVRTHTIASQVELTPWLTAKGKYVYDGISGATPTGAPPPAGSDKVPTAVINDIRRAYSLELPMKFGAHGIAPSFSWSRESDYESISAAATYGIELNQKNTTLLLGVSRDFDRVIPNRGTYISESMDKSKQDVLLGVVQLLDPETVLTANLTFSYVDGYLADPYKGVNFFINYLDPAFNPSPLGLKAEKRPDERFDQIANISLSRFFKPLNASVEAVYLFITTTTGSSPIPRRSRGSRRSVPVLSSRRCSASTTRLRRISIPCAWSAIRPSRTAWIGTRISAFPASGPPRPIPASTRPTTGSRR